MTPTSRRTFLGSVTMTGIAGLGFSRLVASARAQESSRRKMTTNLVCGAIGVSANQEEAIRLAAKHGFESVEARGDYLATLSQPQMEELLTRMSEAGVVWGAAGLSVDFRGDEGRFREGMDSLPGIAAGLRRAGVTRVGTWLSPAHGTLTYLQNFEQHANRLRAVATMLKDHGQWLGLEYVGTETLRARRKHPFVHTFAETSELIDSIGTGNVGFVLDSWHWWTAGDTEADLLSLRPEQVVAVDLNDAPAGIPKEQQQDGRRELPMATGVIDVKTFLNALHRIGYDGPVRAEPFNRTLNGMDNDAACAATIAALNQAMALIQ